jgi:hypothetical protein
LTFVHQAKKVDGSVGAATAGFKAIESCSICRSAIVKGDFLPTGTTNYNVPAAGSTITEEPFLGYRAGPVPPWEIANVNIAAQTNPT